MLRIDPTAIDKSLPVPVGTQLYGLLSYALCFDDLPHGTKLPSVRALAEATGVAPMTVNQVYQQLRDAGLVEIRAGLGAFTTREARHLRAEGARMAALRADIAALIGRAEALGLSVADLVAMIGAQGNSRAARVGLTLAFVGLFEGPTRAYAADIRAVLGPRDAIRTVLLSELEQSEAARAQAAAADLVLTFINREAAVRALLPGAEVLTLPFLPSRATRQALAGLDPRAQVAAVAYFEDYISVLRPAVREFAPQVAEIRVGRLGAPDLPELLAASDAVVYASGADAVAELVRPGVPCFEFRHAPDPGALTAVLLPRLDALRRARAGEGAAPAPAGPAGAADAAAAAGPDRGAAGSDRHCCLPPHPTEGIQG